MNDLAIIEERRVEDRLHVFVDSSKAKYRGIKWIDLGGFGKRKFENQIVLAKNDELPIVHYI